MKVTGFDNVDVFRNFILEKEIGKHHYCVFSYKTKKIDEIAASVGDDIEVINDDKSLFTGKVDSIVSHQGVSENIVTVTSESLTMCNDVERKTRVFHKAGQTYKDILDAISKISRTKIDISDQLLEKQLDNAVLQQNESDFEFIKRMALEGYGADVVSNVSKGKVTYTVGNLDVGEHELKENEVFSINFKETETFEEIFFSPHGNDVGQSLRQYVDIGKNISYRKKSYIINSIKLVKVDGVFRYECAGIRKKENYTVDSIIKRGAVLYEAKVVSIDDDKSMGRVQLDFSVDDLVEDCTDDNKMWFDVLTPYTAVSGGFVFIPDVDDFVKVIWDGESFYICGSLRKKALEDRYKEVKYKQIGNKYEKNICFTDKMLELSAKDSKVTIKDDSIELNIPDSKIFVTKDEISVETKNSKVQINDDIAVDTSLIHIDSNEKEDKIKKSYTCESKNVALKASSYLTIEGKTKVSIN